MKMIKIIEINEDFTDEEILYEDEITQDEYDKIMEVLDNE